MFKACNNYVQIKEVATEGIQTPGDNLKVGGVVSVGEKDFGSYTSSSVVSVTGGGGGGGGAVNYRTSPVLGPGLKVLFDTNKSLKHGGYWYLKAESIFAYDEDK